MSNYFFNEEHQLFRSGFRAFLQKEVVPYIDTWEATGKIDRTIWKKFGEMGYFGIKYPAAYGGLDLDIFYTVIFLEELQRINSGGFAAAMWAHTYLAMTHLNAEASPAFGGSDVAGMRTTAVKKGDQYLINGSKTFITNGVYSDYLIVAAKTNPELRNKGMSIFLIDRDTPGVSASKLDKLGWRASDTGEIAFDDVLIPADNLMGEENKGFFYIMQHFALERLIMGINAHARAEYALEYSLKYMSEREAFGKTINKFQVLRHKAAEMASEIEMTKTFNYHIAKQLDDGAYVVKEASMSKLMSTKMADKVIYDCLQSLGGYGYMEEYPLARMFRDSRLGPIGGGTSEILCEIIAKIIVDKKDYKPMSPVKEAIKA